MRFSKLFAAATALAGTLALSACSELQLDKPLIAFNGDFDGKDLTGSIFVTIGGVSPSHETETPAAPSEDEAPFGPSNTVPENTLGEGNSGRQIEAVGPALWEVAPLTSLGALPRPVNSATVATTTAGAIQAQVTMVNQHAIRNLPITENLKASIARAVGAVYGPGFEVLIYSGGQHDRETATRLGVRRAGTEAHDHGHAADVYVVAPDGVRLTGSDLAPLAQYWLASSHGGVGLEMNGGGIHLDEGRLRYWSYASSGGSVTRTQLAAMLDGKRGVMPRLYSLH